MHFLLYEFVTGGGWLFVDPEDRPQGSLLREGLAMISAVTEDFAALPRARVTILWDARLTLPALFQQISNCRVVLIHSTGAHDEELARIAASADRTLLIAPEFDEYLMHICRKVEDSAGRLLNPDSAFIALTSDKHETAEYLSRAGIAIPHGVAIEPGGRWPNDFPSPAVLKPRDGAGSQGVRLVHSATDIVETLSKAMRLETFVRGQPASVSVICGPRGNVMLPACSQRLTSDGRFSYLGGHTPLPSEIAGRAQSLALRTISALPATCGYVGIDMVLGEGDSPDVVIEVNPRLTTSYVGLRQLVRENLASAMLHTADGDPPVLSLHPGKVEFTADGQVTRHT